MSQAEFKAMHRTITFLQGEVLMHCDVRVAFEGSPMAEYRTVWWFLEVSFDLWFHHVTISHEAGKTMLDTFDHWFLDQTPGLHLSSHLISERTE